MKTNSHSDACIPTSGFSRANTPAGFYWRLRLLASVLFAASSLAAATRISDLEDTNLAPGAYWNGADGTAGFYSGDLFFNNEFVDWGYGYSSWSGFALSRINDPVTAGYGNQYAVWGDGTDVSGSGTYAVAFVDEAYGLVPAVTLPSPALVRGFYVHNTTYTALSIRDGDDFSDPFTPGGNDWFRLVVTGYDEDGEALGSVTAVLADYRERSFLLDQWRWVDLAGLGSSVRRLEFRIESSDPFKPAYFALDGLEIAPQHGMTVLDFDALPYIPDGQDSWSGPLDSTGFRDSAVHFSNTNAYGMNFGFYLSRVNDTTTPGYLNQYAAWGDGADVSGDGQYLVADAGSFVADTAQVTFPYDVRTEGVYVQNTTYAALSMRDGDNFAKKFGGASGDDPDWFLLTVTGKDAEGTVLGTTNLFLADYRFANNALDYIVDDWTWLDLSALPSGVRSLLFTLSSSDTSGGFMNTPAYFAMDGMAFRYAPGGSHDSEGSLLDQGIPGFVEVGGEEILNPLFVGWASSVIEYAPAPGVEEDYADAALALGPVTGDIFDTVSLGDLDAAQIASGVPSGSITLGFDVPVRDGEGPDFAVFENGFTSDLDGNLFAELAYAEVSSDGTHFARLPCASLTPEPVGTIFEGGTRGTIFPRDVHNLAGKHSNGNGYSYGTPFDLADLADDPLVRDGLVDLNRITQVRLVDIPGDGSFVDREGRPIYDAWPTILSGGFDLEAVGVLHAALEGTTDRGVSLNWLAGQRLPGTPTDAQDLDLDNDGQTAWEEFYAGTDANDPESRLQITAVTSTGGLVRVEWQGGRNGSDLDFTLQRRSSLSEGSWQDDETAVPRGAGNQQAWQGAASAAEGGFFRVLVKAPDPIVD